MNRLSRFACERDFILLEAIIAMFVLTVGILAVAAMQGNAIRASTVAYERTEANNIATALIETLQYIPFDDASLSPTGSGNGQLVNNAAVVHTYTADSLPSMLNSLVKVPTGAPAGTIVDRAGITYRLSWAVQDVLNGGRAVNKNIRIFLRWSTPYGENHLEFTTAKYANVSLL